MTLKSPKRLKGGKTVGYNNASKQEKRLAHRLGAGTIKGSGSGDVKGDVRLTGVIRIESKCTSRKSFSITRDMIDKIEEAALSAGEVPAIDVEFLSEEGTVTHKVAVVPTWVLDIIVFDTGCKK